MDSFYVPQGETVVAMTVWKDWLFVATQTRLYRYDTASNEAVAVKFAAPPEAEKG